MERDREKYPIRVIRSSRKSMAIEIWRDLSVCVRVPYMISDEEVGKFLQKHHTWIMEHLNAAKEQQKKRSALQPTEPLSQEEIKQLAENAERRISEKTAYFAEILGVSYGRITIRNQKTRWGSCSSKGNLNFNCLLMLAPEEVLDYVVVHELCHRIEMNHSRAFWNHVEKILPDYRKQKQWLKENGEELMKRGHGKRERKEGAERDEPERKPVG